MIRLGITGSVGMGKSTVARLFSQEGIPVFNSDSCVHALLAPGGRAVEAVKNTFPGVNTEAGGVDRRKLGKSVFHDDALMLKLEEILHPLVREAQTEFFRSHRRHPSGIIAFDIPLLYETQAEQRLDAVIVVTAPHWLQRQRVLARPNMTEERFNAILRRQMPDQKKRQQADFIIHTGVGLAHSRRAVKSIITQLQKRNA